MQAIERAVAGRPRAPAPFPASADVGRRELIRASRENAIAAWRVELFEQAFAAFHPQLGDVIVCNDPDAIKRILVDNHANYPKDPLQRSILARGFGEALLTAIGDDWKVPRRLMASVFSFKSVSAFADPMRDRVEAIVRSWLLHAQGEVIDVGLAMTQLAFDILDETLFSCAMGAHAVAFFDAIVAYSDAQGGRKAEAAMGSVRLALRAIVQARRASLATTASPPQDLLTLLLNAADREASRNDAAVAANLLFFVAAGHETSANALSWALYLLFSTPDVLDAVRKEADAAAGSALPPDQWLDTMVMARAVAEETLRLYPSAPLLSRTVAEPETVAGRLLPRGARIIISPWILHRHRSLWAFPDHFAPERFLPDARESIDRYTYLPFGAGARSCLGARFAMQQLVLVIATVARSCHLSYTGAEPPMPMQRITLRPQAGMPMRVSARQGARRRK